MAAVNKTRRILVVDDDKYGLSFLRSSLRLGGFDVVAAMSAAEARALIEGEGSSAFLAVLTDHRMPGETGLDLLGWIRKKDETLSTVMITAEGEKELVKESLQAGASDFLEKPVSYIELIEALERAIERTLRQRRSAEHAIGIAAAGKLDTFLNTQTSAGLEGHLRLFYRPLHEVGGDFVQARQMGNGRFVIFLGDVSGHDLTAGYVSSYFQGLVRAGIEASRPIGESLRLFNRILLEEWSPAAESRGEIMTSLAISTLEIDLNAGKVVTTVAGNPPPVCVDAQGWVRSMAKPGFPLGWVESWPGDVYTEPVSEGDVFLLFSDGLTDWAEELGIDPLALFYTLFVEAIVSELIAPPPDDLILLRFQTDPQINVSDQFHPLIHETYAGSEVDQIDRLEVVWRRTLVFALENELEDRIFDVLICIREAVLNAMIHGCERLPTKRCSLNVSYRPSDRRIRVRVDDPGKGHQFDLASRLAEMPLVDGRQLGLGMIQHLSDEMGIENEGTSVRFDFFIDGVKGKDA